MGGKVPDAVVDGTLKLVGGGPIETNSTKGMVSNLATSVASAVISSAVSGGADPTGTSTVIHIVGDVAGLVWKAGAYLYHKNTANTQLSSLLGGVPSCRLPGNDHGSWQCKGHVMDHDAKASERQHGLQNLS